ncbi:MAG TPA: UvrD-helicase domain-containing protein [Anaerolineales bacterium]
MKLNNAQCKIVTAPLDAKIFLSGPAGCGKTTVGVERLRALLASGLPADSILVLTPQRTLQAPYDTALRLPDIGPGGQVTLATIGGLARRMVDLFWPLAAESAGFAHPDQPPVFLTLETAQYYMARLVRPLLDEEGFFASVTIDRNRLYSQVLDNLNKAASVGFPYTEIGERLSAAWLGDPGQRRVYADAQESASRFRQYCLEHNLLDFSLQLDIFWNILWRTPECHAYLTRQYRHLICDNVEEDIPVAHDLLSEWLPDFDSALVIFDTQAGYRRFLGADPDSAHRLAGLCDTNAELGESFVTTLEIQALETAFTSKLLPDHPTHLTLEHLAALVFPPTETPTRFYPQMLDWVAGEIQRLVTEEGLPPSEIVVLAPYLSDALRFSLSNRLEELEIPWRSHRPSRSLRDEPASHCLLTLAELAHPGWDVRPTKFDVAYAILYAIEGMDLVRAQLLSEIVYRLRDISLSGFAAIRTEVQERITFVFGQQYETLREWIEAYRQQPVPDPLDHFLRRLFGEILSQKGFGYHRNNDGARTAASLVESVQKFRQAMEPAFAEAAPRVAPLAGMPPTDGHASPSNSLELGKEYIAMLQDGVIAAQYVEAWQTGQTEAVLLAPAHTFLMMNRPASIQFWIDAGSGGWWERLFQPLTQPYVLSRSWERDRPWTDADEQTANQQTLARLVTGLLRRCRSRVFLGLSDLGESGFEQRGPLLKAIWKMQLEIQVQNEN